MQRLRMHPDLGGDAARAALINEAYGVLTDAGRRAAYDESLRQREIDAAAAMAGPGPRPPAPALSCFFCDHPHDLGEHTTHEDDCVRCASPLHPAHHVAWESADQRRIRRIPRRHRILFYSDWPQSPFRGRSRDISLTGMLFATREPVRPGAVLKIESAACSAVARVSNSRASRGLLRSECLVGVEFMSVRFAASRGGFVSTRS